MSLLMSSQSSAQIKRGRQLVQRDEHVPKVLAARHMQVLALRLAGHHVFLSTPERPSIEIITGYSRGTIYGILGRDDVRAMHKELLKGYETDFQTNQILVHELIERGLEGEPLNNVQMDLIKEVLKYTKLKPSTETSGNINISAEDVVFNILNASPEQLQGMIND